MLLYIYIHKDLHLFTSIFISFFWRIVETTIGEPKFFQDIIWMDRPVDRKRHLARHVDPSEDRSFTTLIIKWPVESIWYELILYNIN